MEEDKKNSEELDENEELEELDAEEQPKLKKDIMMSLGLVVGSIGLMFLFNLPALQSVRDSLAFGIIIRTVFSLIPLYFTWIHKSKPEPVIAKLLSTLVAISIWLPFLIQSSQAITLIDMVLFFLLLGYIIYLVLAKKTTFKVINFEAMYFGLLMLLMLGDYTFVDNSGGIHFWQASLIVAIISGIISFVLLKKGVISLKYNRKSEKASVVILTFFAAFAISWATTSNLNYALDTQEPTEYIAIIEDKDMDLNSKSADEYELKLTFDGKTIELNVSQSEYYAYEIGDKFPIKLYKGAFNEPYYISGNR